MYDKSGDLTEMTIWAVHVTHYAWPISGLRQDWSVTLQFVGNQIKSIVSASTKAYNTENLYERKLHAKKYDVAETKKWALAAEYTQWL